MARTLTDARGWVAQGTELCRAAIASFDEAAFAQPSLLTGWTRKHLVTHLAANADAVGNLIRWAASGVPTPMYASMEARNADIEAGSTRPGNDLAAWFAGSAAALGTAMDGLSEEQWSAEVVTAQGRTVPASEAPWMRAREVMVHAVDLGTGLGFADLPIAFLRELGHDIAGKRRLAPLADSPEVQVWATDTDGVSWSLPGTESGAPIIVAGLLAEATAYLAGRGDEGLTATCDDQPVAVPTLPAWL